MQAIAKDVDWLTVLDPDSPRWLVDVQRETIDAYRAGDLGWVLEHAHPDQSRNASISPSSRRYVRPSGNSGGWTISMALPPAGRAHAAVGDVHEPRSRPTRGTVQLIRSHIDTVGSRAMSAPVASVG